MKERYLKKLVLWYTFSCLSSTTTAQVIEHSYGLYNNLSVSAPACGLDLLQSKVLGNCFAEPTPGGFTIDTLPFCRTERMVYHNNLHWGLEYRNTFGTISSTYTIHMYVKNTNWGHANWARIIDFSNGLSDKGIYYIVDKTSPGRCFDFYQNGIVGACPYFNEFTYYLLSFTRNGATGIIDVYINSTLFVSYNDATGDYVGTIGVPIYIYRDDQVISCESGQAYFAYLSFTNAYSSQSTIDSVYNNICSITNTSNLADFSLTPKTSCDSSQNIIASYTGSINPPGIGYTFNWDWDGGNVISGSGIGPYLINWTKAGIKNVSLSATNTSCGNQSMVTKQLVIKSKVFSSINETICPGNDYFGHTTSGEFIDTLVATNGCDSIRTLNLTVSNKLCNEPVFPNIFSPNGDGKNESFKILNAFNLSDYKLSIYNRWGQKIFETGNYVQGWDGKLNGRLQAEGVYVYFCKYTKDGISKVKKGTLVLIR